MEEAEDLQWHALHLVFSLRGKSENLTALKVHKLCPLLLLVNLDSKHDEDLGSEDIAWWVLNFWE
jgi:hypothetical protein